MLDKYNQVFPGCAERIVAMAERQAEHRQGLETAHLHGSLTSERIGQVLGFVLGLVAIGGGIWLIATGKDAQGLTAIITAISGLAGVFIYGRYSQSKERANKRKEFIDKQLPLPYGQNDPS